MYLLFPFSLSRFLIVVRRPVVRPLFLTLRLASNTEFPERVTSLALGIPVVGVAILLASGQAFSAAFSSAMIEQYYRCDSVHIPSLVRTVYTTGR
jgi:hypothetical protein